MGDAAPAAESKVHGELAQANLLRLRGDLDGSEKALLAVLRRYPNDPHAHEMLGDVCVERGEAERAAEWYELALDLAPNSPDVRRKLDESRDRVDQRDVDDAAETLGLPSARASTAWWPLAASGALVVLAVMVVAWPRSASPRPLRETVVASSEPAETAPVVTPTPAPAPPAVTVGTSDDQKLLADLQARAGAIRVSSVSLDPRTQTLEVAFEVAESDEPKGVAIALGKEALAVAPTAMTTSLRAVRAGRLVFAADLARSAMADAEPLTNLWPAPATPTTTPPANGSTASGSTSATEPATTGTNGAPGAVATRGSTPPTTPPPTTTGTGGAAHAGP